MILLGLAVLSLSVAELGWRMGTQTGTSSFPSAGFGEILAGSLAAFHLKDSRIAPSQLGAALGMILILTSIFWPATAGHFPGFAALAPVAGAVLVILYADQSSGVGKVLGMAPLVGIGLISYSAYLWHQPIFAFVRLTYQSEPPGMIMIVLALLTLGIAALSWRFVEQPFRRANGRWLESTRSMLWVSGVVSALFLMMGYAGYKSAGFDPLWRKLYPDQVSMLDLIVAARAPDKVPDRDCVFGTSEFDPALIARLESCANRYGKGALIIGDSHAMDLFATVKATSPAPFVLAVTSGGCRAHDAGEKCNFAAVKGLLAQKPDLFDVAIYEQAGIYLLSTPNYPDGNRRMIAGLGMREAVPEFAPNLRHIDSVAGYLSELSAHVPVVWFGPRTEPHIPLEAILREGCDSLPLRPGLTDRFVALEHMIAARLDPAVRFLSQQALYAMKFPQDFGNCDGLYWRDGDHLSALGKRELGRRADVIQAARGIALTEQR